MAGTSGVSLPKQTGFACRSSRTGSGKTITTARGALFKNPSMVLATITTLRHLDLEAMSTGTNRQPINEAGSTTGDTSGNAFRSNTQFG